MKDGFTAGFIGRVRSSRPRPPADPDFEKCAAVSSDAVSAMVGAGVGGGLGLLADAIRPADSDEDRRRRRLVSLLAGAALGGIAGYGGNKFVKNSPVLFPGEESTVSRLTSALDPSFSTILAAGGLGYGLKPHLERGGAIHRLFNNSAKAWGNVSIEPSLLNEFIKNKKGDIVNSGNPSEVARALTAYEGAAGKGKRLMLGRLIDKIPYFKDHNPFRTRLKNVATAEEALGQAFEAQAKRERKLTGGASTIERMFPHKANIKDMTDELKRLGINVTTSGKGTSATHVLSAKDGGGLGEGLGSAVAKNLRKRSPRGRALSALALLLGIGAAGYKAYDYTH